MLINIHCARAVYNIMLEAKIKHYEESEEMLHNTPAQYKEEYPWLKEADSLALANAQLNLDSAFSNFFRDKNVGFPKFKSKHKCAWRYTTNVVGRNITLEDGYLKLPKVGKVRIKQHRPTEGKIKSVTVELTASRKVNVSILCEQEVDIPIVEPKEFLGLDYSSPCLYIDSNGNEPDYPKFFRQAEKRLAREQRKLSKMKSRSNNWYKQKRKVAVCHEKIANQRKDFLHKLSKELSDNYDVIGIEDLNMRAMSQGLKLGKATMDNGWGMFTTFLDYKLERQGKKMVKVDKWFPSTKTCHECGKTKPMKLNDREYVCPNCGMVFDRDWNAAINIREEAKRIAIS